MTTVSNTSPTIRGQSDKSVCRSAGLFARALQFAPRGLAALTLCLATAVTTGNLAAQSARDGETPAQSPARPNVILVMADDQGWGQTGYNGHPLLKTPNLDSMAESGVRFNRFYAGAPVCSPTRASVLTGRSNRRTGVESHGYALRLQEPTLAQALRQVGYRTGHFGKWHLNGMRGPGVPILETDTHHPGHFGFDTWLSVTNFFDRDPILSRQGVFEEHAGDSSEIVVEEAIKFLQQCADESVPAFTVIWFGTPHSPFRAAPADMTDFPELDEASRKHYGELVAMDRSLGTLRGALRQMKIEDDTLLWFCSDNGGLPRISPSTTGGLRGHKGSVYEGGLRVPAVLEWPGRFSAHSTDLPACTMDIAPTISKLLGLDPSHWLTPSDGLSLVAGIEAQQSQRQRPIFFDCTGKQAVVDNDWKLIRLDQPQSKDAKFELYNLQSDPAESKNLMAKETDQARRLQALLSTWRDSVQASVAGKDYPAGHVLPGHPEPRHWRTLEQYEQYFDQWSERPEYKNWLQAE